MQARSFSFYDTFLRNHASQQGRAVPTREAELEIADSGLTENEDGIVSFAPWTSVRGASMHDDLLLIALASGQYAVIPRASLEPKNITLEQVLDEVARHAPKAVAQPFERSESRSCGSDLPRGAGTGGKEGFGFVGFSALDGIEDGAEGEEVEFSGHPLGVVLAGEFDE